VSLRRPAGVMTKKDRLERTRRLEPVDRPPFVPAVYEHKAALIGQTPSAVARDGRLLVAALRREAEIYGPDVLTVGIDVYNVEAEALGAPVRYFDETNDVPAVSAPVLRELAEIARLSPPDPERDGRMPLFLAAAEEVVGGMGRELVVRGAVTGPFSLACALAGDENMLIGSLENPGAVREILAFAARVATAYGTAFLRRGAEVILFDSKANPAVASPRVFRELIFPAYRDIVMPGLKAAGARLLPLIIGGDTTPVLKELIETGATQLLCDAGADIRRFRDACRAARLAVRVSVDARLVHRGTEPEIRDAALGLLKAAGREPGLLFGCGVVAYDTPPAHVLALKRALDDFSGGRDG